MTEPTLEGLQRELRALRRALYVTMSIAGAFCVAMIASCASKAAAPTHLTFGDANHKVDIDADGLFIVEGSKSVRITAGTVNATDMVMVQDAKKGASVMSPASVRVKNKEVTAVLEVQDALGVSLELTNGDRSVALFARPRFAGITASAPDHEASSTVSETYALVQAQTSGASQSSLTASASGACVGADLLPHDDKIKPANLCVDHRK